MSMVRISDARMSGTAYGTIVLHVTPDAASEGPLAFVRTGDRIRISVVDRRIDLLVDEAELSQRRQTTKLTVSVPSRGYARLFHREILPADEGCDFRSLTANPTGD